MDSRFTVLKRTLARLLKTVVGLTLGLGVMMAGPVAAQGNGIVGAVYAMTNAVDGNEIVVYDRAADGTLTLAGTVATGGDGGIGEPPEPVDALGSQNPLILSKDKQWLFAVNAGSNEISVFRVETQGLSLVDKVNSGGDFPVSLTRESTRTGRKKPARQRILEIDGFRWRDYRDGNRQKTMTLAADEFIRRFLLHVLPVGFQRIRYYGFLANRYRKHKLTRCRELLDMNAETMALQPLQACADYRERYEALTGVSLVQCPNCRKGRMVSVERLQPRATSPPFLDTS